jgi:hypothetical protein
VGEGSTDDGAKERVVLYAKDFHDLYVLGELHEGSENENIDR